MSTAYDLAAEGFPRWEKVGSKSFPVQYHHDGRPRLSWVIGPTFPTNKEFDYLWTMFAMRLSPATGRQHRLGKLFPYRIEKGKAYSPSQGHMRIPIFWGNDRFGNPVRWIIEGKSATNPQSLQGEEVDDWIQSEAAEQPRDIWNRYGATRARRAVFPTTPKMTGAWLKELIEWSDARTHTAGCSASECSPDCEKGQLGLEWFQFTPHSNPAYDWSKFWQEHQLAESRVVGAIRTAQHAHDCFDPATECSAMKDPAFAEQFGGKWTFDADRVLPFRWNHDHGPCHVLHKIPDWFHAARYYVACDHGYTDPAAVLWAAIGTDGTILLYREIYESGMDPRSMVNRIVETSERFGETISMYVPDPQRPEVAKVLRELNLPLAALRSADIRDRAAGHARLVEALSIDPDLGRPRLFVLSERAGGGFGCPRTISEWKVLRRKPGNANEFSTAAFAGEDHAFDAARYLLMASPTAPKSERWKLDAAIRRQIMQNQMVRRRVARAFDARFMSAS